MLLLLEDELLPDRPEPTRDWRSTPAPSATIGSRPRERTTVDDDRFDERTRALPAISSRRDQFSRLTAALAPRPCGPAGSGCQCVNQGGGVGACGKQQGDARGTETVCDPDQICGIPCTTYNAFCWAPCV
jgi:hypothetical protein